MSYRKSYDFAISNQRGLSIEQIRSVAPAVFADEAHESRSASYGFVDTEELIRALALAGMTPIQAMQSRARSADRFAHARHLLRFAPTAQVEQLRRYADIPRVPNIVIVNDSLGTTAYRLFIGIFEIVCQNGLITMSAGQEYRIPHRQASVTGIVEGTLELAKQTEGILDHVDQMRAIRLQRGEQLALAAQAISLHRDVNVASLQPYEIEAVLTPRYTAQAEPTLWNTYNNVQRHLERGGDYRSGSNRRTGATNSVSGKVKLNTALYTLTEQVRRIHTGEPLLVVDAD